MLCRAYDSYLYCRLCRFSIATLQESKDTMRSGLSSVTQSARLHAVFRYTRPAVCLSVWHLCCISKCVIHT